MFGGIELYETRSHITVNICEKYINYVILNFRLLSVGARDRSSRLDSNNSRLFFTLHHAQPPILLEDRPNKSSQGVRTMQTVCNVKV